MSMKITILLDKSNLGFAKLHRMSDYGKFSVDAFADRIITPFQVFSETSPTFLRFIFICFDLTGKILHRFNSIKMKSNYFSSQFVEIL